MTSRGMCYEYLLLLYTFPNFSFLVSLPPCRQVDWSFLCGLELLEAEGKGGLCCPIFHYRDARSPVPCLVWVM